MNTGVAIGLIGAGRLGAALSAALVASGYVVRAIASRRRSSAQVLAKELGSATEVCSSGSQVAALCDMVFITTPDNAIGKVADEVPWTAAHSVVHCSGALSVDVLSPVLKAGGAVGGFHPLQSFTAPQADAFCGITIGLESGGGSPGRQAALLTLLKQMAHDLGSRWIVVRSEKKAVYHAAAVLASNYVVTLMKTSTDLLKDAGVGGRDPEAALLGLLRGVLRNMSEAGLTAALTGPIARGDTGTVQDHLDALSHSPDLAEIYRLLGRLTVPIAQAKGTVTPQTARQLLGVLDRPRFNPQLPATAKEVSRPR